MAAAGPVQRRRRRGASEKGDWRRGEARAALPRLRGCQPEAVLGPGKGFQAVRGGTGWAGGAWTDLSNDRLPASHLGAECAKHLFYSNQLSFLESNHAANPPWRNLPRPCRTSLCTRASGREVESPKGTPDK